MRHSTGAKMADKNLFTQYLSPTTSSLWNRLSISKAAATYAGSRKKATGNHLSAFWEYSINEREERLSNTHKPDLIANILLLRKNT